MMDNEGTMVDSGVPRGAMMKKRRPGGTMMEKRGPCWTTGGPWWIMGSQEGPRWSRRNHDRERRMMMEKGGSQEEP